MGHFDLNLSAKDWSRLKRLIWGGNPPRKLVARARIASLSDKARLNSAIAEAARTFLSTARFRQRRIQTQGVEELLRDKTLPPGAPPQQPDTVEMTVAFTLDKPPGKAFHWSRKILALVAGVDGTIMHSCGGALAFS